MDGWKLPWTGACRCGETRFQVTAPPLLASACHCTGCQKMAASAFSLSLTIPSDGFAVTAGDPVVGGLHGATQHFFCPRCKSWLFTKPEGLDTFVNLRPSTLDDHAWFVPFIEVWTREKLPWATTPAVHSFAEQPALADYLELTNEFATRGARPMSRPALGAQHGKG
jgi:hypothetical protein